MLIAANARFICSSHLDNPKLIVKWLLARTRRSMKWCVGPHGIARTVAHITRDIVYFDSNQYTSYFLLLSTFAPTSRK